MSHQLSIGIDANEANVPKRVGTGEYTYQLLRHFAAMGGYNFELYLRDKPLGDMPAPTPHWHYHQVGPRYAWTRLALPFALGLSHRHQVFLSPAHYLPPVNFSPSVVTIHDLAYEYFPELFLKQDLYKLKKWTRSSVKRATSVIAVSASTKRDLVKLYGVDEQKIKVVYNGYDQNTYKNTNTNNISIINNYDLRTNSYILFIGTLQPRKNIIRLVQAFELLKLDGYQGKLVLAGKIGWMATETLAAIENSRYRKEIIMTGYIADNAKQALLRHASTFVLPSLYEGFGLPALEAMASSCPTVVADNSSLPEVVGDAGLTFSESDPVDLKNKILEANKRRTTLIKLGLAQAAKFSWEKCAKETLEIIKEAAQKTR